MILLDVNLLIYAINRDSTLHSKAKAWLESVLSGAETVGISWNVLLAFVRVTTRPGLFRNPLPVKSAFDVLESWLASPFVNIVHPGQRHLELLRECLLTSGTGGNLTSDAHLAALAIEHGSVLCSTDNDFARFPRLEWLNPLT